MFYTVWYLYIDYHSTWELSDRLPLRIRLVGCIRWNAVSKQCLQEMRFDCKSFTDFPSYEKLSEAVALRDCTQKEIEIKYLYAKTSQCIGYRSYCPKDLLDSSDVLIREIFHIWFIKRTKRFVTRIRVNCLISSDVLFAEHVLCVLFELGSF